MKLLYIVKEIIYYPAKTLCRNTKYLFQRLFRKSHMSELDSDEFHIAISKWLLPKMLEYKKDHYDAMPETHVKEWVDNLGRTPITKSEFDEIIYALEWALETSVWLVRKREDDFFIKYYGKTPYPPHQGIIEKNEFDPRYDNALRDRARRRAQKGFETLGYHFTNLGNET